MKKTKYTLVVMGCLLFNCVLPFTALAEKNTVQFQLSVPPQTDTAKLKFQPHSYQMIADHVEVRGGDFPGLIIESKQQDSSLKLELPAGKRFGVWMEGTVTNPHIGFVAPSTPFVLTQDDFQNILSKKGSKEEAFMLFIARQVPLTKDITKNDFIWCDLFTLTVTHFSVNTQNFTLEMTAEFDTKLSREHQQRGYWEDYLDASGQLAMRVQKYDAAYTLHGQIVMEGVPVWVSMTKDMGPESK